MTTRRSFLGLLMAGATVLYQPGLLSALKLVEPLPQKIHVRWTISGGTWSPIVRFDPETLTAYSAEWVPVSGGCRCSAFGGPSCKCGKPLTKEERAAQAAAFRKAIDDDMQALAKELTKELDKEMFL